MVDKTEEFVCVWDGIFGRILSQGYKFTTNEKLDLSFEFDTLYYETDIGTSFKIINNEKIFLSDSEITEIQQFCKNYADVQNYEVQTYDPNDGVFMGVMLKSEALKKKLNYRLTEIPDHPASKWTGEEWEKIKASILENGRIVIDPPSVCDRCVLTMTEAEFNNFPKQPSPFYIWDFKIEKWIDPRKIDELKKTVQLDIRNSFESVRWRANGKFIPQFEQETWNSQIQEAKSWLKDKTVSTPYIDEFLKSRTDDEVPTKEILCQDILTNHENYLRAMARVNAIQWKYLKEVENATTNDEVDKILKTTLEDINKILKS